MHSALKNIPLRNGEKSISQQLYFYNQIFVKWVQQQSALIFSQYTENRAMTGMRPQPCLITYMLICFQTGTYIIRLFAYKTENFLHDILCGKTEFLVKYRIRCGCPEMVETEHLAVRAYHTA